MLRGGDALRLLCESSNVAAAHIAGGCMVVWPRLCMVEVLAGTAGCMLLMRMLFDAGGRDT
jgi:Na+-transporting NADH:ubiquinone oxidoreductase subunit NqrB